VHEDLKMIGLAIGHYRIIEKLGEGGMGEVYRAADTRLGRDIALKVLPPALAHHPERLARFQQEARALAALDHSGIVTVYSVEHAGDRIPAGALRRDRNGAGRRAGRCAREEQPARCASICVPTVRPTAA
jgi:serine/threonine protein kinase